MTRDSSVLYCTVLRPVLYCFEHLDIFAACSACLQQCSRVDGLLPSTRVTCERYHNVSVVSHIFCSFLVMLNFHVVYDLPACLKLLLQGDQAEGHRHAS